MNATFTLKDCRIAHETSNAVLVTKDDKKYWLPFSQVTKIIRNTKDPERSAVVMSQWIASQKGLL